MGVRNRSRRSTNERRTGDGAPYDVWEGVSVKPTPSVIRRKGRRGRRPLRWLRDAGISGAVRWAGGLGVVFHTCYVVCRKAG